MNPAWRLCSAALFLLSACRSPDPSPGRPAPRGAPLAEVNGEAIDLNAFQGRFQRSWTLADSGEEPPLEVKQYYLRGQIEECLVLQEAQRLGLEVTPAELEREIQSIKQDYSEPAFAQLLIDEYIDWDEWKESLRRQMLIRKAMDLALNDRVEVSDKAVAAFYQKHAEELAQPAQVHARQAVVGSQEAADQFRTRVLLGEDFGKLAKTMSQGPEADQGGDLGWLSPGQILRPLDRVLFTLPAGKIADPVKTDYGWHVLLVVERREARVPSLLEMKPAIEKKLRAGWRERLYKMWVAEIWLRSRIKINYQLL